MEIGSKLRQARLNTSLTQEKVATIIHVSRQTISNWENEKSYPDILSIVQLSELYNVSLDVLLKDDEEILNYLDQSTNTVKSNQKLFIAISLNIILLLMMLFLNQLINENQALMIAFVIIGVMTTSLLFFQIMKKL